MTYIYSRKAYHADAKFAKIVEATAKEADNLEHHMRLIQKHYPRLEVIQLSTYEHSGICIDTFKRCSWDSSADAFGCYSDKAEFEKKLEDINKELA